MLRAVTLLIRSLSGQPESDFSIRIQTELGSGGLLAVMTPNPPSWAWQKMHGPVGSKGPFSFLGLSFLIGKMEVFR